MSNLATKSNGFSLTPSTLEEAMKLAEIMAKSTIVPTQYQGKPGNILIAVQMGADLGLKPMQALQNIAVINGKPCLWGDSLLALVQKHPAFEDISESVENGVAICTIKRKGQSPHTVKFSIEDAKKAGLLGKQGPWSTYTNRMLQLRARGFALRDRFADALGGLITAEEAQDYPDETKVVSYPEPSNKEPTVTKTQKLAGSVANLIANIDETPKPVLTSSKEQLISELTSLLTNPRVDEGFIKMCDKLQIPSILDMTEDQLIKAIEWAKARQGEKNG